MLREVSLDRDQESLEISRQRLRNYSDNCKFIHGSFSELDSVCENLGIKEVDGMLFDLGISSYQLDDADRGFTFQRDGPLDMRLDRSSYISAYDLLNSLNEKEISAVLKNFGEERWHNRIARYLVREREKEPISSTAHVQLPA